MLPVQKKIYIYIQMYEVDKMGKLQIKEIHYVYREDIGEG